MNDSGHSQNMQTHKRESALSRAQAEEQERTSETPRAGAIIAFVTILSMVPQFSTDLYMPALPSMVQAMGATSALGSASMTAFFFSMAAGVLIVGPISDAVGRRPTLIACSFVATAVCATCIFINSMELLIALRLLHGFAGGGLIALSTSLIKDCFSGKRMENVVAITQAMMFIAPTLAPLLGAAVLLVADWRGTFVLMDIMMAACLVGSLITKETLPKEKRTTKVGPSMFSGLVNIAKSRGYVSLALMTGLLAAGYFTFLTLASFIYEDQFGVSQQVFGLLFALSSIIGASAALSYVKFSHLRTKPIVVTNIALNCVCGILMCTVGGAHPAVFFVIMAPVLFVCTFLKPRVISLMLESGLADAGATSSAFNFVHTIVGCIGQMTASLIWGTYVQSLGVVTVVTAVLALVVWLASRSQLAQAMMQKEV